MKKERLKGLFIPLCLFLLFLLWTWAVKIVDVQQIGPRGSAVGFATINQFVHNLTGVHLFLYTITDWLGLVPIISALGFAFLGLIQWIKKRRIYKVDYSILVLGGFYIVVMAVYLFFEIYQVNFRPLLINGYLETSYPSSTTMLVLCVMPTAIMQLRSRIKNKVLERISTVGIGAFIVFMVIGRFVSGVHWFTDIIGGAIVSAGLVLLYRAIVNLKEN